VEDNRVTAQLGSGVGLKVQEESMHELARMAEARQAEARQQVESLLAERSQLLEAAGEAAEVGDQPDIR